MTIFFNDRSAADFDSLIGSYRPGEFNSPTRSTVPLLSLLRYGGEVRDAVLAAVGADHPEVALHLEYTVDPPRGIGRASHTDAMLISDGTACAVEAKWTEPPYETLAKWLGPNGEGENRGEVARGWLSLLRPHAAGELELAGFSGVTYQTIHRAASACASGASASLAYLQFTPQPDGVKVDARPLASGLRRLRSAMGDPAGFSIHLIEVEIRPTAAFEGIRDLPKGKTETGEAVRSALRGQPLFDFIGWRTVPLDGGTTA